MVGIGLIGAILVYTNFKTVSLVPAGEESAKTDTNMNSNTGAGQPVQGNMPLGSSSGTAGVSNESGLTIEDIKIGSGEEAKNGMLVTVHYTGRLLNGRTFDSSLTRGEPFQFVLGAGQVIKGWDQGILGMKVGGERVLVIAPALAYGENNIGIIPPNSTLVFEVELLSVGRP